MSRMLSRRLTQQRHQQMSCRVRILKLNYGKCSLETREKIDRLFLEAKWFTNHVIANGGKVDTKIKEVPVVTPDGVEVRQLTILPSHVKQDLVNRFKSNCKSIKTNKAVGNIKSGGRIKFVSEVNSIPFRAQAIRIIGEYVKLTNLGKLRFRGFHQLIGMEVTSGNLVRTADGYTLHLTTFVEHQASNIKVTKSGVVKERISPKSDSQVGIDLGIKTTLVTSAGEEFNLRIGESDTLKNLQRKFNRAKKGSNNRRKLNARLRKEYIHVSRRRADAANKIVNWLCSKYDLIAIQDENIKGWQKGLFGKQVQHSCLGAVKSKLISKGAIVVPREVATTKVCHICGEHNSLTLSDRMFSCSGCGHSEHRDVKAAKSILFEAGGYCSTGAISETVTVDINQPTYVDLIINSSGLDERLPEKADPLAISGLSI